MSVQFDYPDKTTPTTTLTFERAFFRGDLPVKKARQDKSESDVGEMSAYSYGDTYTEHALTVQVPKAAQAGNVADNAKLIAFVSDTLDWGANQFYYTDSDGTAHLVNLVNSDLSNAEDLVSYIQYRLVLREES